MMRKVRMGEEEKQRQIQNALEKELKTLIREYLVLDYGDQHRQFSKGNTLEKRNRVLDIFKKEHANIQKDLDRAASSGRIKEDQKYFSKLIKLLEDNSSSRDTVNKYKIHLRELDMEAKAVQKDIVALKKDLVTDRQHEKRVKDAMQTLEALENRLETQMIQFGTICTTNKLLRGQIDSFLAQRNIFMNQWEKLIEKLTEGRKVMLDLIEQATIAYNQREDWCTKLRILRQKARLDFSTNMQEMREQKRKYDNNLKLKEFFWIKGQKRVMKDLEQKEKTKREMLHVTVKEKLNVYEGMLLEIKTFCRQDSIHHLAHNFIKQEEVNLSNFSFITETIREAEAINDRLGFLHLDVEEHQAINERRKLQQQVNLENLERELQNAITIAKDAEASLNQTTHNLNTLLSGVSELFKLCKCDNDPLLALLGDNKTIQFFNAELYLKILESAVHRMLVACSQKGKKKTGSTRVLLDVTPEIPHIFGVDAMVRVTPCSLCAEHEMVSDVIDTLQSTWTKSEALTKLEQRLALPGGKARLHTISHCQLPRARGLMQRRYE